MAVEIRFCGGKYNGCVDTVDSLNLNHAFFDMLRQVAHVYVRDQDSLNYYYDKKTSDAYTENFAVAVAKTGLAAKATERARIERMAAQAKKRKK